MNSRSPKSDPQRKLSSRFGADEDESDDTTRRQADPVADAHTMSPSDPMIPIDEDDDDVPTRTYEPGALDASGEFTPPPPVRQQPIRPAKITPPPPPARPARFDHANAFMPPPPLPPESPFDEFPPTPGPEPAFNQQAPDEPEFAAETPLPAHPLLPFTSPPPPPQPFGGLPPAPALNFGGGPPPGRPGGTPALPRPGGYLDPAYGANLHMPPPAPASPAYDNGGGFGGFPETVDFGRNSAPVVVRRSGPPGIVVLLTLIAGAAGGVWLGEKVTHNAVAALEASTAAKAAKAAAPRKTADDVPSSQQRK